jgi:hypothetical protein
LTETKFKQMKKNFLLFLLTIVISSVIVTSGCKKDKNDDNNNGQLTEREQAIKDYEDNYIGSFVADPQWTGSVNGCLPGSISQDARNKVIQRLNYFRRICGLNDDVTENTSQHQACQEASLIFKAENNLSHFPPQTWACWTQNGYNAAGKSNIAWGTATSGDFCVHSTYGVTGFIEDPGAGNEKVGHRAWFLLPGLNALGVGSTNSTSCMMWENNFGTSTVTPDIITYPPKGYVPNQIIFPRWSFSIPGGATYSGCSVTMTDGNGANVPLNIIHKGTNSGGWPDPQLVWEPQGINLQSPNDQTYTITVTGVSGAAQADYTYDVTIVPVTASAKKQAQTTGERWFK